MSLCVESLNRFRLQFFELQPFLENAKILKNTQGYTSIWVFGILKTFYHVNVIKVYVPHKNNNATLFEKQWGCQKYCNYYFFDV